MGLFDDRGPAQNTWTNMALFKIPSSRPPEEVAGDVVRALPVTLVLIGLLAGASFLSRSPKSVAVAPPANGNLVSVEPELNPSFREYERIPKSDFTPSVRFLSQVYDGLNPDYQPKANTLRELAPEINAEIGKLLGQASGNHNLEQAVLGLAHQFHATQSELALLSPDSVYASPALRHAIKYVLFEVTEAKH